jgi:hypothetical protein
MRRYDESMRRDTRESLLIGSKIKIKTKNKKSYDKYKKNVNRYHDKYHMIYLCRKIPYLSLYKVSSSSQVNIHSLLSIRIVALI